MNRRDGGGVSQRMADKFWAEIYSLAPGGEAVVAGYTDLESIGPVTAVEDARAWAAREAPAEPGAYFLRVLHGKETLFSGPLDGGG